MRAPRRLVAELRSVLEEGRQFLGLLNAYLGRTAADGAIDRARMEAELGGPLRRVMAACDALKA